MHSFFRKGESVGDMTRTLGRPLDIPLVDPADIKQYFGEKKKKIPETKVSGGISVESPCERGVHERESLDRALQYGDHSSADEHMPTIWKKLRENVRRGKRLRSTHTERK